MTRKTGIRITKMELMQPSGETIQGSQIDDEIGITKHLNDYRDMIEVIEKDTGYFSSKQHPWSKGHAMLLDDFLVHLHQLIHDTPSTEQLSKELSNVRALPIILTQDQQEAKLEPFVSLAKQLDGYREMIESINMSTGWLSRKNIKGSKTSAAQLDNFLVHLFTLFYKKTPEEHCRGKCTGRVREKARCLYTIKANNFEQNVAMFMDLIDDTALSETGTFANTKHGVDNSEKEGEYWDNVRTDAKKRMKTNHKPTR